MANVLTLLRGNRAFLLLWLSQVAAGAGDMLFTVSAMVMIYERSGSALQTMGVTIAMTLPAFLFGPLAGVVVDRAPRRLVLVGTHLARAAIMLILLTAGETPAVWITYLAVAGLASAGVFFQPARLAAVPMLVAPAQIVSANSILVATQQGTLALGYLAGGVLALHLPLSSLVALTLACSLLAAALAAALPARRLQAATQPGPAESVLPLRDLRNGVTYLLAHPIARPLFIMEFLEHVPHGIWTSTLMLVFVEQALAGGAAEWGLQNGVFYASMLVGSALSVMVGGLIARWPGRLIIANAALAGVLTLAYSASINNGMAVVLAFGFGVPFALRDVAQDSLLQTTVDGQILGRTFAFRDMGRNFVFMLSGLMFAVLADLLPIRLIFVLGGVLYLGTALYAATSVPLRRSRITGHLLTVRQPEAL